MSRSHKYQIIALQLDDDSALISILTKLSFSFKRLDILFIEVMEFPGECSGSSESESNIGDLMGITDFFRADRRGALKQTKKIQNTKHMLTKISYLQNLLRLFHICIILRFISITKRIIRIPICIIRYHL